MYGCFVMRRFGCIVSPSAHIICLSLIETKGLLQVGAYASIHALSTDGVKFGNGVSVGEYTRIECTGSLRHLGKGMIVGDNVGLGSDCFYGCAGGIEIGSDTIVGNFVSMHSENHVFFNLTTPIRQ